MEDSETDIAKMHPTKAALVSEVVTRLGSQQPYDIRVDTVLQSTRISSSSLYHHFENFEHLLETGMAVRYASFIDHFILMMRDLLNRGLSKTEFLGQLESLMNQIQASDRRVLRLERARILAAAEGKPRFEAIVARESSRLTKAGAAMVEEAMRLGYFQSRNDPKAVAVLVQAYTLGRIVDDFNTINAMDNQLWVELIGRILREIVFETDT
jgi:AcrR family transcriptional regulator